MTFARHRWIVALALVALLPACGPKKAKTTPDLDANTVTTPSTPTTDVEPRPQAEPAIAGRATFRPPPRSAAA